MLGVVPFNRILDKEEAKAFCLIDDARLTSSLDSLSLRCRVASFTIFFLEFTLVVAHLSLDPSSLLLFPDPVVLIRQPLLTTFV